MTNATLLPSVAGGVLLVSPSNSLREQIRRSLHDRVDAEHQGLIHEVQGGADALVKLESGQWRILFLDRHLRDLDVEELMQIISLRFPGIEVVLLDSGSDSPIPASVASAESWLRPEKR